MDSRRSQAIGALLEATICGPGISRGASAGVRTAGCSLAGSAGTARADSIFDLASLTKPCVALLSVGLARQGLFRLDARLDTVLPELSGSPAGAATIEQHLSHRANMRAHIELFRAPEQGATITPAELVLRVAWASQISRGGRGDTPPPAEPRALYSDLGYILVGRALEVVTARPLDVLLREVVTGPLNLELDSARGWRRRTKGFLERCLPTEAVPERGGLVQGVVHDDNAWVLSGSGLCGHAGLFGTLDGTLGLAHLLVRGAQGHGPLLELMGPLLLPRAGGSLLLGLDGVSPSGSTAGAGAEEHTFGHLGFTGTSFWCDPGHGVATVLLTNRTFPSRRSPAGIRAARPLVHDALRQLTKSS